MEITVDEANERLPFEVVVPSTTPPWTNPSPRIFLGENSVEIFYDEGVRADAHSYRLVLYESMAQAIMVDSYYPRTERFEGTQVQIATRLIGAEEPDFYAAWNQGDVAIFLQLFWVKPEQAADARPTTIPQEARRIIESMINP